MFQRDRTVKEDRQSVSKRQDSYGRQTECFKETGQLRKTDRVFQRDRAVKEDRQSVSKRPDS